jgi:type II secretory ATPase GspE/PulE/Tfp pilus assembly ATPase PilB-like protein
VSEFVRDPPKIKTFAPSLNVQIQTQAKSLALCSSREARRYIDFSTAVKLRILPLSIVDSGSIKYLRIAVAENSQPDLHKKASFICGLPVQSCSVSEAVLLRAIENSYKTDDVWLGENLEKLKSKEIATELSFEIDDASESEPVPKALRVLLEYSIAREASDIHLIPSVFGLLLKLRVKGEMYSYKEAICPDSTAKKLLSRIKVLSSLRTDLKAVPQEGNFSIKLVSGIRQIRVSIMPTIHGEKCVLRITSRAIDFCLNTLGFSQESYTIIKKCLNQKEGLILISGSTGSGKTTSLYALVQELVRLNLNVVSVEDPVEAEIEGVSQTSLNLQKGLDCATALKATLRQDPDCIMLGEIRDSQSAKLCLSAALSGHLVLSSIHAGSCRESIVRLSEFGCDSCSLNSSVRLLINQSLVPRLCAKCKVLDLRQTSNHGFEVFKSVGCVDCDYSGFSSRMIVPERFYSLNRSSNINLISKLDDNWEEMQSFESKTHYLEKYFREGLILGPE